MHKSLGLALAIGFALIVIATNKSYQFDDDMTRIAAGDSYDYLRLSQNAPQLPQASDEKMGNERAQRIFGPLVVGLIAQATGSRHSTIFQVFDICLVILCASAFYLLLRALDLGLNAAIIGVALYAFNPYAMRFTLSFPGMISDLIFAFGLILLTWSLLRPQPVLLVISALVMILGRQTALATLPCVLACLSWDPAWQKWPRQQRAVLGLAYATIIIAIFALFTNLSAEYATRSHLGAKFIFGIFAWFAERFDWQILAVFITRGLLSIALPGTLILLARSKPQVWQRRQIITFVLSISVMAQPYLAGPWITEGSVQRLSVLGIVPLITCGLLCFPAERLRTIAPGRLALVILVIMASSLHHSLSSIGFAFLSKFSFPVIHFALVGFAAYILVSHNQAKSQPAPRYS